MLFNSLTFLVFFSVVLLTYFAIPSGLRKFWLLVVSCVFYAWWNPAYILLIASCVIVTYGLALLIDALLNRHADVSSKRKAPRKPAALLLAIGLIAVFGVLIYFKYCNMLIDTLNKGLMILKQIPMKKVDVLLPVGISFYTFQSVGYLIDVFKGKIRASKNPIDYALFITFFPQLVAGPIERSGHLLGQIKDLGKVKRKELWNLDRIRSGLTTMLWGYYMKVVVADRAAIFVDNVFQNHQLYGSVELLLGVLCFSLQIYCDFAGYSAIAIGAAKVLGIDLMDNFKAPYFSKSFKEFWSRWHISLSTWFKDYLYFPLGGSRKGKLKKYRNLMIVFLLSGLWHGAEWSFVVWGGLHGLYRIAEEVLTPRCRRFTQKHQWNTSCFSWKLLKASIVFGMTTFAWVFFRADTMRDAVDYIGRMLTCHDPWVLFDGGIFQLGIEPIEFFLLLFSVLVLIAVDAFNIKTGRKLDELLQTQNTWFRWGVMLILICSCVFFNSTQGLSQNQFIYFQF